MCGFAGFVNLDGRPASSDILRNMLNVQRHRGPDDQGFRLFSLERAASLEMDDKALLPKETFEGALGFNRLSILDLSRNGHQPMSNEDGTVFLVFNGEVYNAFDYVPELTRAGFRFRSRTDTEVILRLYEQYGLEGMLQRLNGMFAIALVDLRKQELFLVRDHFGIKPLYWSLQEKTLFFSSEIKSFLAHPGFQASLDHEHLGEYLLFRYCAAERHLLKNVFQLRPGHLLRLKADAITMRKYWEIPDGTDDSIQLVEAVDRTEQLIHASVKSQLLSDVKVGCQLSGGIDSSLITLSARKQFAANMDAFSVVFHDRTFSEEEWIQEAAATAGVVSHRFLFDESVFQDSFMQASWHMDQPLSHPNAIGIYHLARKSHALATVMLSGEGADELFGGYFHHYYAAIRPRLQGVLPLLGHSPVVGAKFRKVFGSNADDAKRFFILSSRFQELDSAQQFCPSVDLDPALEQRQNLFLEGAGDNLGNCLKYDMQTYMVELLVRQDKMTMAHSMENRVPYLDRNLVEFVRRLPRSFLVGRRLVSTHGRMGNTKIVLKKIAAKAFGEKFVYRKKSGFPLPINEYLRSRWFTNYMEDVLIPAMRQRGIWDVTRIVAWWQDILHHRDARLEAFWTYVAFEAWAIQFLDRRSSL